MWWRGWVGAGGAMAVLLLVPSALAGCGSGGTSDEDRMDAALLRLSDLPDDGDWTVEPTVTEDPFQAEFDVVIDACEEEHDPTVGEREAEQDSPNFVEGDLITVGSSASVVADADLRDEFFDALDPLLACFGPALSSALEEGAHREGGEVDVDVSEPFPLDVSTAAGRTEARALQLGAASMTFFIDVVAMEEGSVILLASFIHDGTLSLSDEEDILAPAVARMQNL